MVTTVEALEYQRRIAGLPGFIGWPGVYSATPESVPGSVLLVVVTPSPQKVWEDEDEPTLLDRLYRLWPWIQVIGAVAGIYRLFAWLFELKRRAVSALGKVTLEALGVAERLSWLYTLLGP